MTPAPRRPVPRASDDRASDDRSPLAESYAKLAEFEQRLVIDRRNLDTELIQHPERYYHTGKHHARAKSYMEQAKADMKAARSKANLLVRDQRKAAGERITEDELEQRTNLDAAVIAATRRYHEWIFLESAWLSLTISVYERRPAIEGLIKLEMSQSYDPSIKNRTADDARAERVRRSGE
jgi:hypothetical protein